MHGPKRAGKELYHLMYYMRYCGLLNDILILLSLISMPTETILLLLIIFWFRNTQCIANLFTSLPGRAAQVATNSFFSAALLVNNLPRENYSFKVSEGRSGELNNTPFNHTFALFQASPIVIRQINYFLGDFRSSTLPISRIIDNLHGIVTLLRLNPRRLTDCHPLVNYILVKSRKEYYSAVQRCVWNFVAEIDKMFSTLNHHIASLLDVPNLYRLLELVIHFLPNYGHCNLFSNSAFETKYQPLKKNMLRDKHTTNLIRALQTDMTDGRCGLHN